MERYRTLINDISVMRETVRKNITKEFSLLFLYQFRGKWTKENTWRMEMRRSLYVCIGNIFIHCVKHYWIVFLDACTDISGSETRGNLICALRGTRRKRYVYLCKNESCFLFLFFFFFVFFFLIHHRRYVYWPRISLKSFINIEK